MSDIDSTIVMVDTGEAVADTELVETSTLVDAPFTPDLGASQEPDAVVDSETVIPEGLTDTEVAEYLFEVDGVQVNLDEARNGYLRQADYTRKTQEVAAERARLGQAEALAAAFESDPAGTVKVIAESLGLQLGATADPIEELDPESRRIAELERQVGSIREAERMDQIDADLAALHAQYGEFDDQALFAHAIKGGFNSLGSAYRDLTYDDVAALASSSRQAEAEQAARVEAKRQANTTVHSGSVRAGTSESPPVQTSTIREAYAKAKRDLGIG